MDTKSVNFGRWLEQATREELVQFIVENVDNVETNGVDGIDEHGYRPTDIIFRPRTNDSRDCDVRRMDLDQTYVFNEKVATIKTLRARLGLGLKTAKDAVETYEALYYPRAVVFDCVQRNLPVPGHIRDLYTVGELEALIDQAHISA